MKGKMKILATILMSLGLFGIIYIIGNLFAWIFSNHYYLQFDKGFVLFVLSTIFITTSCILINEIEGEK
jgi:uncharacterized membrane protein